VTVAYLRFAVREGGLPLDVPGGCAAAAVMTGQLG
jgi:hypothetical protein